MPGARLCRFTFYGGARAFARYRGPEALLHGPAETGKTLAALWKLHLCALKYPGASLVIARKVRDSIYPTVLQTYLHKVLGEVAGEGPGGVVRFGGEKPVWFDYPNGARIWVAGLDKAGKVLSAEHDLIYVNQAEELTLEDWETLTTRTTGRAGHMPYSQTVGDCNPAQPTHWMYHRPTLRVFTSRHEENPALFDQATGEITAQGRRTLAALDALTGVRKERLRYGRPAQVEGAVYDEWDPARHVWEAPPPGFSPPRRTLASQDWGYANPGCLGVWALDGDDRMLLVRQVYARGRTIDWWREQVVSAQRAVGRFEAVVCDPSQPAYIAAYRSAGLPAIPADNAVLPGINAVKARLAAGRLAVLRDSLQGVDETLAAAHRPTRVEEEFPMYVWAAEREAPVKADDHGLDMLRYAVRYVDAPRGWSRGPARG